MFRADGYPNWFLDKCVEKFLKIKAPQLKDKENVNEEKLFFRVPYVGKSSQLFTKQLSKLIAYLTSVKLIPTYKTFKVGNYWNDRRSRRVFLCVYSAIFQLTSAKFQTFAYNLRTVGSSFMKF